MLLRGKLCAYLTVRLMGDPDGSPCDLFYGPEPYRTIGRDVNSFFCLMKNPLLCRSARSESSREAAKGSLSRRCVDHIASAAVPRASAELVKCATKDFDSLRPQCSSVWESETRDSRIKQYESLTLNLAEFGPPIPRSSPACRPRAGAGTGSGELHLPIKQEIRQPRSTPSRHRIGS
jgi:hypothetical protein